MQHWPYHLRFAVRFSGDALSLALLLTFANVTDIPVALADEVDAAVESCRELLPEFDDQATDVHNEVALSTVDQPVSVRISWRRSDAAPGVDAEGWIVCFFLPLSQTNGAWFIDEMDTQKYGRLRRYELQQLYKLHWLNKHYLSNPTSSDRGATSQEVLWLYLLQQTLNALTLGCLYALLAVGFTILYNVTHIVNLAFGDLYMIGAYVTYVCYVVVVASGETFAWPIAGFVLLLTIAVCAAMNWASNRLVFRRIRHTPSTVSMVASIGVAMILRDVASLSHGAKAHWMPPTQGTAWQVIGGLGYDVYLRKGHLIIGLATGAVAAAFWWAGRYTKIGRGYRATAQDARMAALVGVNVDGTIGVGFLIAGGMTGIAALFAALQYQIVDPYMGYLIGFKALVAAILGGLGFLEGAFLGGVLIALVETYAGMAFGYEWRELAVFSVMALVLIFRPSGIYGAIRNNPADERI